jgi:hypothetical protein
MREVTVVPVRRTRPSLREGSEVRVVHGSEHGIAVAKDGGVPERGADLIQAIMDERAADRDLPLIGRGGDRRGAETVRFREAFREIDAAGPVLGAGMDARFDERHGDACSRQHTGGGDARRACADNDHIEPVGSHGRSQCCSGGVICGAVAPRVDILIIPEPAGGNQTGAG